MLTYIGFCCREWVLVTGLPVGPCGVCGEVPKYLREDDARVDWKARATKAEAEVERLRAELSHTMCGKSNAAELRQRVFAENAALAAQAERDAAREALARVEALADEIEANRIGAFSKLDAINVVARLRAALAQPATDEGAGA